jgi:hypothetical protein
LVGLPGRIGTPAHQGSHPGPISFYALAPVYRLLGSSAFSLQAATVVLQVGAIAVALWLARRRGGRGLLLAVAAVLALLITGYGPTALTEPWNPYLPVLWWVVTLLAVWSVLCGDVIALPIAVAAGSLCAQTHVPYLGLVLGIGALAVLASALLLRGADRARRNQILRWTGIALAVGVVLWLPPTLEQLRHHPGNYSILVHHFSNPPAGERTVPTATAAKIVLQRLDVGHLLLDGLAHPGLLISTDAHRHVSEARGAFFLVLWGITAVAALRLRRRDLLMLHGLVALGIVLEIIDVSRIFGTVWYYLLLSIWGVAALMAVATGWTLAVLVDRALGPERRSTAMRVGAVALAAVTIVFCARLASVAPSAHHSDAAVSSELAQLVPPTVRGLDRNAGLATGKDGRYLVTWNDAAYIGSPGYGLVNELERRGFDVGVVDGFRVTATAHRVLDPSHATAQVALATGSWVDRWRAVDGAVEVAHVDPRTDAQRAEFDALRTKVIGELTAKGLDDLVPRVDDNLFGAAIDQRVPASVQNEMGRMLVLGVPAAVFVAPPTGHP